LGSRGLAILRFSPWVYLYYVAELYQVHLFVSVSKAT
jgi:hypothetical protein